MSKLSFFALSVLCLSLFFTSCKDDVNLDLEKPEVVVNNPVNGTQLQTGESFEVNATFSDDILLKGYSIQFSSPLESGSLPLGIWDNEITGTLSNALETVTETITVPTDISAGQYVMTVTGMDDKDKDSDAVEITLDVLNASDLIAPSIDITAPDFGVTLTLDPGTSFTVDGTITDNAGLFKAGVQLLDDNGDVLTDFINDANGATSYTVAETFAAPLDAGTYTLKAVAIDGVNNITESTGTLLVQ